MSDEGGGKNRKTPETAVNYSSSPPPPNCYYGTFQGVANYQPPPPPGPQSVMGFPQPAPPLGFSGTQPCYPHGHQAVIGYAFAEVRPVREDRLPCCGVGVGWFLQVIQNITQFIIGFFLSAIPWYIGAFLLLWACLDYREKPGLVACSIAALLAALAVTLSVTRATHSW